MKYMQDHQGEHNGEWSGRQIYRCNLRKLLANSGTQTITQDFKNLQTPTHGKLVSTIDMENDFELKSSGHYIICGRKDTPRRLHLGRPKSYQNGKFFSGQATAVDSIEKLEYAAPTLDTETKSTDQPRPAAFSND